MWTTVHWIECLSMNILRWTREKLLKSFLAFSLMVTFFPPVYGVSISFSTSLKVERYKIWIPVRNLILPSLSSHFYSVRDGAEKLTFMQNSSAYSMTMSRCCLPLVTLTWAKLKTHWNSHKNYLFVYDLFGSLVINVHAIVDVVWSVKSP